MRWKACLVLTTVAFPLNFASAETVAYSKQAYLFASFDVPSGAAGTPQLDTFTVHRDGQEIILHFDASTPHYDDREVTCGRGYLAYKLNRPNIFAYSCKIGPQISYGVIKYGKTYRVGASDATEQIGFTIDYPVSQKSYWDPVISHIVRSLRFEH